jgi:gas vesicle protein
MNTHTHERRDYGFVIGLLTGTFVGAGLALWLAPPSGSELRGRTSTTRVGEVTRKAESVRDEVERDSTAASNTEHPQLVSRG